MTLKVVIFDMDETLLDWSKLSADRHEVRRIHLQQLYDHLVAEGHPLPDFETFGKVYVKVLSTRWGAFDEMHGKAPRYRDMLRDTLGAINLPVSQLDFDHLQTLIVGLLQTGVTVFPDAQPVLVTLRAAGVRIALLTNSPYPMFIRDVELETLNLLHLLDVRLTAEEVGYQKPHPSAFTEVLSRLGVSADEAVSVGDDLLNDVQGAQRAGMRAVWVQRHSDSNPHTVIPNATIAQLAELPAVLDSWFPGWR